MDERPLEATAAASVAEVLVNRRLIVECVARAHVGLKNIAAQLRAGDYDRANEALVDVERELFAIEADISGTCSARAREEVRP